MTRDKPDNVRWYDGVTRYQWVVLIIASLGWVFDVFEGQIFVASMNEAMPSLLPDDVTAGTIDLYNQIALGAFLVGGALGGVAFGMLSDRIGRTRTMTMTILVYSLFTCVSAFSQQWWHLAVFRFLVALGVGGEWAVASALVAEVFPPRARAWSLGIFHASSVFGTYLAIAAGAFIIGNPAFQSEQYPSLPWRIGFGLGLLPAALILWIRHSLHEPESWRQAKALAADDATRRLGRVSELFGRTLIPKTLVGVGLAAVGLATFWGAHIYGKDLLRRDIQPYFFPVEGSSVSTSERSAALQRILAGVRDDLERQPSTDPTALGRVVEFLQTRMDHFDLRKLAIQPVAEAASGTAKSYQLVLGSPSQAEPTVAVVQTPWSPDEAVLGERVVAEFKQAVNERIKLWEMLGMFLVTTGGGIGLVSFGPLCERIGRRGAFLAFHVAAVAISLMLFQSLRGVTVLLVALPVFGFMTLGMHAGYAIYFPELFPTRLRATGAGFCFNFGRIVAAPILFLRGLLRADTASGGWGLSLENAASLLSLLFLAGACLVLFGPETRGTELPD